MADAIPDGARGAAPLDVAALPTLADFGFTGGRDGFVAFRRRAFASGAPRFLRTEANDLVVFRNADLRALGALPQVANVPPAILFGGHVDQACVQGIVEGRAFAGVIANQLFTANEPVHAPLRHILLRQIGPRALADLAPAARQAVHSVLDPLGDGARIDIVAQVAEPLAARFWAAALGLTETETAAIVAALREMTPLLFPQKPAGPGPDAAAARYRRIIEAACERALAEGDRSMVQAVARDLAALDLEGDLDRVGVAPRTAGTFLAGNLFDGFHTVALAAANIIQVLLRDPQALAQAPSRAEAAALEALRLEPPVIVLKRWLNADVIYDGWRIPQHMILLMVWAAGDHDPAAFPEPEQFDAARPRRADTTFGAGASICPGRHVAVMLAGALIQGLLDQGLALELDEASDAWMEGHVMSQLHDLPATVRRRSA